MLLGAHAIMSDYAQNALDVIENILRQPFKIAPTIINVSGGVVVEHAFEYRAEVCSERALPRVEVRGA